MKYGRDYDKILTRLISILALLNDGKEPTSLELAKEFGVSTRTTSRDFNRLTSNFPIYKENRKWKMQEGTKIDKNLSFEDEIVLDMVEGMAKSCKGDFSKKATNLLNRLKNQTQNPFFTKLNIEDISDKFKSIKTLEEAIKNLNIITASYNDKSIKLKPQKITNFEGFWYLIANDTKDNKLKKYYLKNLSDITLTNKRFKAKSKIQQLLDESISVWFDENVEPFEVRLFIDSKISKYFERKPLSSTQTIIGRDTDGSLEISVKITNYMEITPIIKYWLPHIKVLEPKELAKKIEDDLKIYLDDVELCSI